VARAPGPPDVSQPPVVDDPGRLSPNQRLRFLAKDVVLYGGATAVSAAFGLISFPLLARHFSIEQYGLIDFFNVVATFMTTVFVFGQDSAVARFFYEYTDLPDRRQVGSQSLAMELLLLLAGIPILWVLSGPIAMRLSGAPEAQTLLKLVLLQVPFLLLINFSQTILKWTFARTQFLIVSIGSTILAVAALIAGMLLSSLTPISVFVILLAARALCAIAGLWFIRGWLTMPRGWRCAHEMLPFAVPLGIICTVGVLMPVVERALVAGFVGDRELGLYAAGARVAMMIALPISAFQIAWGPFSLAIHKQADAEQTYNWVLKAFTLAMLSAVVVLTVVAEPVIRLLASSRYVGASVVVFPIAMGLTLQGIGWITSIGIGIAKRSYFSLYAYLAYGVANIGAIYVLLRIYGLIGAACGVLIGHLCKSFVETWLAQRAYRLQWAFGEVVGAIVSTAVVGVLLQMIAATYGLVASASAAALWLTATFVVGVKVLSKGGGLVDLRGAVLSRIGF
jgi:O-antigen/teichoic acid export membrane protein